MIENTMTFEYTQNSDKWLRLGKIFSFIILKILRVIIQLNIVRESNLFIKYKGCLHNSLTYIWVH